MAFPALLAALAQMIMSKRGEQKNNMQSGLENSKLKMSEPSTGGWLEAMRRQ